MSTTKPALDNENRIREIINQWFTAVKTKDAATLLSLYADDAVLFPPSGELEVKGARDLHRGVREWLDMFDGDISANNRELNIVAGDDVAFAFMITKFSGKGRDGKPIDMTARATVGFERRLNNWVATHEHASFPVDMASGPAGYKQ